MHMQAYARDHWQVIGCHLLLLSSTKYLSMFLMWSTYQIIRSWAGVNVIGKGSLMWHTLYTWLQPHDVASHQRRLLLMHSLTLGCKVQGEGYCNHLEIFCLSVCQSICTSVHPSVPTISITTGKGRHTTSEQISAKIQGGEGQIQIQGGNPI